MYKSYQGPRVSAPPRPETEDFQQQNISYHFSSRFSGVQVGKLQPFDIHIPSPFFPRLGAFYVDAKEHGPTTKSPLNPLNLMGLPQVWFTD